MSFTTSDIRTPQPTRQDFADAFGNNQRLIRFFEQLTSDVRQTIPDAIVSVQGINSAPFIVQTASALTPNAFVLQAGSGIALTTLPGVLRVALNVPVPITSGGTGATTATAALSNLGGVTAAGAAAAAPVQSVFGRIGAVVAQAGDYTAAQVTGSAPLASPAFTGVPTAPTAAAHTNTTQLATTQFVESEFASPPALGSVSPNAAAVTTLLATSTITPSQTAGIVGTTTNNNANAGSVGESVTATGTAVSATTGVPFNVTSIPLSAGDWEVFGTCSFNPAGTTLPTVLIAGSNNVSATLAAGSVNTVFQLAFPAGLGQAFPIPTRRFSLAAAGTVYLVADAVFTVSTLTCTGTLEARRLR